jgi:uncharacterized protein (DUF1697 family)
LVGQDDGVPSHIALLRGINVGGRNQVAMADLRRIASSLGHTDVATYIQSGNVVFTPKEADTADTDTAETDTAVLAADLEQGIAAALGVGCRVAVLSREELAQVARDNPYPDEANPKFVHAVFLTGQPGPELLERIAAAELKVAEKGSRDTVRVVGKAVFLHTPDGYGRSDLAAALLRIVERPELSGTARNWATVTKLLDLCGA